MAFGIANELKVDSQGVVGGGEHLSPEALHELVDARGDGVQPGFAVTLHRFEKADFTLVNNAKQTARKADVKKTPRVFAFAMAR